MKKSKIRLLPRKLKSMRRPKKVNKTALMQFLKNQQKLSLQRDFLRSKRITGSPVRGNSMMTVMNCLNVKCLCEELKNYS
jgi:hypothetical protein